MCKFMNLAGAINLSAAATSTYAEAAAGNRTLDSELSNVSFGSIKNSSVGEFFSFGDVNGSVSTD